VRGIIAMGHRLGMKLTAKGVETEAELGFLRRNHCDYFIGHLFSPPLPAEVLDPLIQRRFLLPAAFAATRHERTLLLLDDEENMLRSLVRLFRRDGYKVLTAGTVREAFDLLASNTVQVIVSDQRMPDMSGTEFLAKVRELYPDTVRMVLSGYTDLATITEAINRGAIYRFLTKPWNDDELRGHIQAAFRSHERKTEGADARY
jgi:ActR/RegA family two-component response regulator